MPLHHYNHPLQTIVPAATVTPKAIVANAPYFLAKDMAKVYQFPTAPTASATAPVVVGVISLGGGLFGNWTTLASTTINRKTVPTLLVNSKTDTTNDTVKYVTDQGLSNQPTILVKLIDGTNNSPTTNTRIDGGATYENSLDVQSIVSNCNSPNLVVIMYLAPNTDQGFINAFTAATTAGGAITLPARTISSSQTISVTVRPSVVSCSWGLGENLWSSTTRTTVNTLFANAVTAGINICCSSGDNGSTDGEGGSASHVDFPASSPNVVACGGTNLICARPGLTYAAAGTSEVVWGYSNSNGTGGGVSAVFALPSYQNVISPAPAMRAVPDIAMNADPNTGVVFRIKGNYYAFGGTSVVAPTMAAYIATLSSPGFVNMKLYPLIAGANAPAYANYKASFHDITSGNNGAYAAGAGYDECTGLGSLIGTGLVTTAPFVRRA